MPVDHTTKKHDMIMVKLKDKMLKKLLIPLILASYLFVFFASFVPKATYAQESVWYLQRPSLWYKHVYDDTNPTEIFGERYTAAQTGWVMMSFITYFPTVILGPKIIGCGMEVMESVVTALPGGGSPAVDLGSCVEGFWNLISVKSQGDNQSLAESKPKTLLSQVFADKPISGITYTKNALRKLNIIEPDPAYAQSAEGFGYNTALSGSVATLWLRARNVSFTLFVLAAIILSFMVMFRFKTSPQTAVSIQSAIPKLVISLILITFSFAIAGFLIDIMYVVIGIVSLFFGPILPNALVGGTSGSSDISTTFAFLTTGILGTGIWGILLFDLFFMPVVFWFAFIALAGGIGPGAAGAITNPFIAGLFAFIGIPIALLFLVILFIAILFVWFKISWLLLKTTATFLMLVMFAPIYLVLGVFVGSLSFGSWIKNLITQLAVFPTVGILFTLSYLFLAEAFSVAVKDILPDEVAAYLVTVDTGGVTIDEGWPPLMGAAGDPGALILLGISLIFLFMAPKAADLMKSLISGRPFGFGSGIGEAYGFAGNIGSEGVTMARRGQLTRLEAAADMAKGTATYGDALAKLRKEQALQGWIQRLGRGKL